MTVGLGFDIDGGEVPAARETPLHRFPLPPPIPGRAAPVFNGNGQYRLPDPDAPGKLRSYTRASTVAKTMEDTWMLNAWQQRSMLLGVQHSLGIQADLEQLVAEYDGPRLNLAKELRQPLNDIADRALTAAGTAQAAEFGTAVHAWCEVVDIGMVHLKDVPELYKPWVESHRRIMCEAGLTIAPEHTERIVLNSKHGIAGTFDRLFGCPDGELRLGDIKTSRAMDYSWMYFSIQLAIYRGASHMLSLDGTHWEPMPYLDPAYGLISHLPREDPYMSAVVPINLYFGDEALDRAMQVRDLRTRADKEVQHTEYVVGFETPHETRYRELRYAIETSSTEAAMAALWEENQDIWTDDLTHAARISLRAAAADITAK